MTSEYVFIILTLFHASSEACGKYYDELPRTFHICGVVSVTLLWDVAFFFTIEYKRRHIRGKIYLEVINVIQPFLSEISLSLFTLSVKLAFYWYLHTHYSDRHVFKICDLWFLYTRFRKNIFVGASPKITIYSHRKHFGHPITVAITEHLWNAPVTL